MRPGSCILPLAVRMSWHCLWQSCLLQNSTGIPAPFETFLWLALRRGPIFGAVGLHAFCLPSLRTLHVLGTFSQVPRRCLRWPPTPWDAGAPCSNQKFYISSDGAHTQLCHALDKNWIIEVIRWELNPITRN